MKATAIGLALLTALSGGCEEISRKTIVRRAPQRQEGMTQAETQALPADCVPACKPPKFCDHSTKPPKCVVAVDDPNGPPPAQPHSLQINLTDHTGDPGEGPSDDETAPQPY